MTYDPNREPGERSLLRRDGGMWGWIIAIAAVVVLGIIVWAAIDTEPEVAGTTPPATQSATPPSTIGSAPTDNAPAPGAGGGSPKAPSGAKQ